MMIKGRFIIPGKDKKDFLTLGYNDYLKKLQKYGKFNIEYVNETSYKNIPSGNEISRNLDIEANNIIRMINDTDYVILVDIHAKEISSLDFANKLNKITSFNSNLVFIFGSSYGLSDILRKRANYSLSLSKFTFTHYHSLLIVLEQLYRSFKILNNETYDK